MRGAIIAIGLLLIVLPAQATPSLQTLPCLPTHTSCVATSISSAGTVAGYGRASATAPTEAVWWSDQNGVLTPQSLGLASIGNAGSVATGINANNQVVGNYPVVSSTGGSTVFHAFVWQPGGSLQDLGTFGGDNSYAGGINDKGAVVGWAQRASGIYGAFYADQGGVQDFDQVYGGSDTKAYAVNDNGIIVGCRTGPYGCMLMTWDIHSTSAPHRITTPAQENCVPSGISDNGQVVGECSDPSLVTKPYPFVSDTINYNPQIVTALPAPTQMTACEATSVNSAGIVLGDCANQYNGRDLVLWPGTAAPIQLTDSAWLGGYRAAAINDAGQFVAQTTGSPTQVVTGSLYVLSVSPASCAVPESGAQSFAAAGGTAPYTWQLASAASSKLDQAGNYVAGWQGPSTDFILVSDSTQALGVAKVSVGAPLTLIPSDVMVPAGGTQTFVATGGSGMVTQWSVETDPTDINSVPGTMSGGVYTAPAYGRTKNTILAVDTLGNTARATVTIGPGPDVSISPANPMVPPSGSVTFTAQGGWGSGWVWRVSTNHSGARIDSTGHYTAGFGSSVTDVVAVQDALGNSASVQVVVGSGLLISPQTASIPPRGSVTFMPGGGSGTGYAWSMKAAPSGGQIDAVSGLYTAGTTGNVTDTIELQDSLGNAVVWDVKVSANLTVTPTRVSVAPGSRQQFTASGGASGSLAWSLTTNNSGGRIDQGTGLYIAGNHGGTSDIVAVKDSLGNMAVATISVIPALTITPAATTVVPKGIVAFKATGGSGVGQVWSLPTNASGGSIDARTGNYVAGTTASVTDVVQLTDSSGAVVQAHVMVEPGLAVSPTNASVAPLGSIAFAATGGSGNGRVWSLSTNASGGSIDARSGNYVAGATGNVTDVVQVTDTSGAVVQAQVTVGPGVSASPTAASVLPGGTVTFKATGGSGEGYSWRMGQNRSGGFVTQDGHYKAGSSGGVTDFVVVSDSLGNTAAATIAVSATGSSTKSGCAQTTTTASGLLVLLLGRLRRGLRHLIRSRRQSTP